MAEEAQPQASIPSSSSSSSSSSANSTQVLKKEKKVTRNNKVKRRRARILTSLIKLTDPDFAPPFRNAMDTSGLHGSSHSASQIPSVAGSVQNQETIDRGQGLYAVQCSPFMGMMPEYLPSMLIPLTYKIPMRTNSDGEEQGQGGDAGRQHRGPQRQIVVRRFQVAFQLDLALLLKLAFVVVLLGQDGSRQRMMVLILLATLVYLYQTGVLTPLFRYARRELAPPRPVVRPQNAGRQNNVEGNGGDEIENQPAEGEQPPEPERANGLNLWGFAREIQTFIIGFITSLLPGFEHQHND